MSSDVSSSGIFSCRLASSRVRIGMSRPLLGRLVLLDEGVGQLAPRRRVDALLGRPGADVLRRRRGRRVGPSRRLRGGVRRGGRLRLLFRLVFHLERRPQRHEVAGERREHGVPVSRGRYALVEVQRAALELAVDAVRRYEDRSFTHCLPRSLGPAAGAVRRGWSAGGRRCR
ncbi:hypothetical protein SCOCK_180146 [Actinacidiphila cocklensis]|uniref:Uncharacterized protein n=1 Tax=Actinacidiphila cocklensis TaxID=887465 RepID=A0A9W4DMA0_9ACTN|nr:hypothetical protein SCOCK_180146 [Actinacidiphila cocklensis]